MKNKKTIISVISIVVLIAIVVFLFIKFNFFNKEEIEYFLDVNLTAEQIQQYEERKAQNFESLELFPNNYNVYMDLGNIERELGNASKAIEYFTKAWEIIPTNSTPWLNIGNIYIRLSLYEKAEQAFLKAIDINESYYFTWYNLAKLYGKFMNKDYSVVRGVYLEGLIKTNNDYQLLDFFIQYLIENKNYSEALQYLNVLLQDSNIDQQAVSNKIQEVEALMGQGSQ